MAKPSSRSRCKRFHDRQQRFRRIEILESRRLLASTPFNIADYPTLPATVQVGAGSLTSVLPGGEDAPARAPNFTSDFSGPVAAAEWWSSIGFSAAGSSNPVFSHPLATQTFNDGLAVGYPRDPVVWSTGYRYLMDENLRIKLNGFSSAGATVSSYSDWAVTTRWENGVDRLETTFGHGLPFIYATRQGNRDALIQFDQSVTTLSNTGGVAHVTIQGKHYGLFAPSNSQWVQTGQVFRNNLAGNNFFSVALLPDNSAATLEYYRQRAYAFVTDTAVTWNYDATTSTSNATYTATTQLMESGDGRLNEPLMALYRHQWLNSPTPLTPYTYNSARGQMKVASGSSFTTAMTHHGVLPVLPELGSNPAQLDAYIDQVFQQTNLLTTTDSYFTGTEIYKLAQLIPLAEQVGHTQARDRFLNEVREELEDWFSATDGGNARFYYDQNWDTLIGYPDSFGSASDLNDHHFHYGYFIQSAAIVGMYDPQWAQESNWGGMVELLIRDVANWERDDQTFQFLRNFDVYAGHAWASGNALFERGNNQESSSEAMNFANGLILWGSVTGDDAIRDLGIYMSTTHQAAIAQYWLDVDNVVFNPAYPHPMIGILWSDGVDYATFFSGSPEHIQGINYLPLNGGSLYLGHQPAYVQAGYNHAVSQNGGPLNEWTDLMSSYLAFADPVTALANFNANPSDDIQPLAKNYHWISSLNAMGQVDPTVTANIPSYAVFNKAGVKTYVAYNPTGTTVTAAYSDGMTVSVPAFTYVARGGNAFTWTPGRDLLVTSDETTISEAGGMATITVTRGGETAAELNVTLTSNDTHQAIVDGPTTRVIQAGQTSTTFIVKAVDDLLIDGNQLITFTAMATGFPDQSVNVAVIDDEPADNVGNTLYLIDSNHSQTLYSQNFDGLTPSANVLADNGWQYFSDNAGLGSYGGGAPGQGPQISALISDGGSNQYINFYANYGNSAVHSNPSRRELISLYQTRSFTGAEAAAAESWHFDFEFANNPSAPITGDTQVSAFIRVFDNSFNLLGSQTFSTNGAVSSFVVAPTLSLTLNPAWSSGGLIQFGFSNRTGNYNGSGIFYDNVRISKDRKGELDDVPGVNAAADLVPDNIGNQIGIPVRPIVYQIEGLNSVYDAGQATKFDLYLDAAQSIGLATQARVSYDFQGDGTFDRMETYNYFATDPLVGWERYTEASGIASQSGAFANLTNGTVRLEIWNVFGSGNVQVRTSARDTQTQQSSLRIPYAGVQSGTVRVEFASADSADTESLAANVPRLLVKGTLTAPATIDTVIVGGSAVLGTDFSQEVTVSIPAGMYDGSLATSVPVPLLIVDDNDAELNESILMSLANPSVGLAIHDANGDGLVQKPHAYHIFDDDHTIGSLVADYAFQTDFATSSSDTHLASVASAITSGGTAISSSPTGNPNRGLLLGSSWNESSEVNPSTLSTDYLTFSVTPNSGMPLTPAELTFDFFRDASNSIRHYAIYADDDAGMNPGSSGGDNFQTKIGSGMISSTGTWTTARAPLGGVPFLQQIQSPMAFRIYFWGDSGVDSVARVDNIRLSQVAITTPPQVERVVLNEGGVQRSSLTSLTITFDRLVNAPASAFSITNLGVPSGSSSTALSSLVVNTASVTGKTVATITFNPGMSVVTRNSINTLDDGNYRLVIHAGSVMSVGAPQPMAQDYVFGSSPSDDFFRRYGDINGDGFVDFSDFANGFLPTFGSAGSSASYRDELDSNGDGNVDFHDFANGFLPNFGTSR